MNKSCIVIGLSLFFVLFLSGDASHEAKFAGMQDLSCNQLIEERFARIGTLLGNTWDVLGLLRSITIQPAHRAKFLASVVDDAIMVLDEVAQLTAYCKVCNDHCSPFLVAFENVGDRFAGVSEAFHAICATEVCGEERVIGEIIRRTTERFNSCWATALKVDATSKTDH